MDNTIKGLQLTELNMLKEIDRIARISGLTYFALGGTLLGAIRHKGFIPWDDDIDIGFPRKDYDKLLECAPKMLPDDLEFATYETPTADLKYFARVYDKRTHIRMHLSAKPIDMNAFIDIFPLDGMPNNRFRRYFFKQRTMLLRLMIGYARINTNAGVNRLDQSLFEKTAVNMLKWTSIDKRMDPIKMMKQLDVILKKYPFEGSDHIVNFYGRYRFKEAFPKKYYGEGIEVPFEDMMIRIPEEYDLVLKQMYGDYMVLPPEETRALHHMIEIIKL